MCDRIIWIKLDSLFVVRGSLREIAAHLEALPARQRDVLRSIAVDSASIKATAAKLSMSEGAVRVALHRGLANLTAKLRKQ